jgi:hypothetical protein
MDVIFPRGSARNLSREMMGDYNGYVIVKAIVGMARDLGLLGRRGRRRLGASERIASARV